MNGGKRPLGYTIVEVLIVLAASSMMFLFAANFINGKQARTAFTSGTQEMVSRVQSVIDQVTDGRYSDRQFSCTPGGANLNFSSAGGVTQGTNPRCVFLGKYMHFDGSAGNDNRYRLFSLAGQRLSGGKPPTNFSQALVTPIDTSYGFNLTTPASVPQQVSVRGVVVAGVVRYGLGFIQDIGALNEGDASGNTYASGYREPRLLYSNGHVTAGMGQAAAANALRGATGFLSYTNRAVVCMRDDRRFATITIGESGNQLSVRLDVRMQPAYVAQGCPL